MKRLSIKIKLIILFVLIKIIPLVLLTYLSIIGTLKLNEYFISSTENLYLKNQEVIKYTAQKSIQNSIEALDENSQKSIEKYTNLIAKSVADFLYERDKDLLLLSSLEPNLDTYKSFYTLKNKDIKTTPKLIYDEKSSTWIRKEIKQAIRVNTNSELEDNSNKFRFINSININTENIPIYKEITFIDLDGREQIKVSSISEIKKNISDKNNTYIKAEEYFSKITSLKKGEIYVSNVIGEYVKSNIIGTFTKEKAKKMNIDFKPQEHGFAGLENPIGKKFDGIIRFVTPVFKEDKKIGYLTLALDHRHVMEYTDTFNPSASFEVFDISDASIGNYAFMWDNKGRNISHPRDYFIVGYDSNTGEMVPGWVSKDIKEDFEKSEEDDLNSFLAKYPEFYKQSLDKKPNILQLKNEGEVGLDCRYLNFAPQCKGWMELTQDGGYGSFIIYWSNVWKLTTASTIPYYTGQYGNTKRGFGFVTIGANVEEFHSAATETKKSIDKVVVNQIKEMNNILTKNEDKIQNSFKILVEQLSVYTILMIIVVVFIAIWMSNYLSNKILKLMKGTKEFSENNLDYRIKVSSSDEIGKLESSFNDMAQKLKDNNEEILKQNNIMSQQSKMAAMGEMLENIAHQWRQPLSMISTCASATKLQNTINTLKKEEIEQNMSDILDTTIHLSNTIEDFRSFFKPEKNMNYYSIEKACEKANKILSSKLCSSGVELIEKIEDEKMYGLENELIHVLMNIINNANDAYLQKNDKKKLILLSVKKEYDSVEILLHDGAGGIPDDKIERIFEPYFTTKHKSQGTGIGLYMTREMVVKHMQGDIKVENSEFTFEDKKYFGAKFTLKIPKHIEQDIST